LDRDLNAQLLSQFEGPNQYIDPDSESVAPPCDDEDMVLIINIGILEQK